MQTVARPFVLQVTPTIWICRCRPLQKYRNRETGSSLERRIRLEPAPREAVQIEGRKGQSEAPVMKSKSTQIRKGKIVAGSQAFPYK